MLRTDIEFRLPCTVFGNSADLGQFSFSYYEYAALTRCLQAAAWKGIKAFGSHHMRLSKTAVITISICQVLLNMVLNFYIQSPVNFRVGYKQHNY